LTGKKGDEGIAERHKAEGRRSEIRCQRSEGQVQSLKFENAPEINQKTWNLELGTLNLIGLRAE